jgi:disulfide bond formation protein DsbB
VTRVTTRAGVNFLALLTVAANLAVVGALVLVVGAHANGRLATVRAEVLTAVRPLALPFAAVVAMVATVGSLWLSKGADFVPCELCWYQRIAMYPLVVLLGLAAIRRDVDARVYGLVIVGIGFAISTYHYLVERFPSLESGTCDPANPCSLVWVWKFHYISIPFMAGSAFALIAVLLAAAAPLRSSATR